MVSTRNPFRDVERALKITGNVLLALLVIVPLVGLLVVMPITSLVGVSEPGTGWAGWLAIGALVVFSAAGMGIQFLFNRFVKRPWVRARSRFDAGRES